MYTNQLKCVINQIELKHIGMKDVYTRLFALVDSIFKLGINAKTKPVRYLMIEIIFKIVPDFGFKIKLLELILTGIIIDTVSSTTILALFAMFYENAGLFHIFWKNPNGRKKMLLLLSSSNNYSLQIDFTPSQMKYLYDGTHIVKSYFVNKTELTTNWFISGLIQSAATPTELKYLVTLSITDIVMIQYMYMNNTIDHVTLNKCVDSLGLKLEIFLCAKYQGRIEYTNRRLNNDLVTLVNQKDICEIFDEYMVLKKYIK